MILLMVQIPGVHQSPVEGLGFLKHQQYVVPVIFCPAAGLGRSAYLADAESGDEIVFFVGRWVKKKSGESVKREKNF